MPGLKITLLQQPLVWMDGPANLLHFDRQLEGITGRDVIVLPEMFTSGFAMEAAASSLVQDDVVNWMTAKAQQCLDTALCNDTAAHNQNPFVFNIAEKRKIRNYMFFFFL